MSRSSRRPLAIVIVCQWDSVTELAVDIATLSSTAEAIGMHFACQENQSQTSLLTHEWGKSIGSIPLVWVSVEKSSPAKELILYLDRQHAGRDVRVLVPISLRGNAPWVSEMERELRARSHLTIHHVSTGNQKSFDALIGSD